MERNPLAALMIVMMLLLLSACGGLSASQQPRITEGSPEMEILVAVTSGSPWYGYGYESRFHALNGLVSTAGGDLAHSDFTPVVEPWSPGSHDWMVQINFWINGVPNTATWRYDPELDLASAQDGWAILIDYGPLHDGAVQL